MTNGKRNEEAVAHAARCNNVVQSAHDVVNAEAVKNGLRKRRMSRYGYKSAPVG